MNQYDFETSAEHRPVAWWRGYPVYAAHFIVIVFAVSMLATTAVLFARASRQLEWLVFSSTSVLQGQLWRLVSYGLVNEPSISFALDMLMIIWFGREVERHFGRQRFLLLYGGIYLIKPLLFTALGWWRPTGFAGEPGALALFVAFATLFPNAPLLFNILAKWAAVVIVGIIALMALAERSWVELLGLAATCGLAWAFVRHHQGAFELPRLPPVRRAPKLRVLPGQKIRPPPAAAPPPENPMTEVDALLDKIAISGIHSLTAQERARLESARAELLKRGSVRK